MRSETSHPRILVLSPRGRDAAVIAKLLAKDDVSVDVCSDVDALTLSIQEGATLAIVTEEAMADAPMSPLFDWIDAQPSWSDFPFVVLATRQIGPRPPMAKRILERLGNVILLERPVNAETLMSAVTSALRSRRRQYQSERYLADRERAQEALRRANGSLEARVAERTSEVEAARETLAFALDSAEMGSWDLDLINDVARRSSRHDAIFGYADVRPEWGMGSFLTHVVPDDRAGVQSGFEMAIETGGLAIECRIERPNGEVRWIMAKGRVEYDDSGTAVRMAGVVVDITKQRETEDALRQAQKMEAIGQLTGGVAHDFNNLLTVVVGALDMIIRRPLYTERVTRLADAAMSAARRGEQLTQQLLAFSRRQMIRPQTIDPNRLLLEFKALGERAAGGAIAVEYDLDPAIDAIHTDPTLFESAILNLIVNSRDAMNDGAAGGSIRIATRNRQLSAADVADRGVSPGAYVVVSVSDVGSGMPAETIVRAFEPFFTTKEVGKGSGLGLAQVYGFARSAGGYVAIDSEVGSGTTIKLYFPRSDEPVGGTADVDSEGGPMPLPLANGGETVLLVEDDEEVLGIAIESLKELDYSVVVARTAREALACFDGAARIDLLLSDVVMPGGMNGAQLAVEARKIQPSLKVLLTSGYVADLDGGQTIGDGRVTVLNKPYRRDELARSLRAVLAEKGSVG